MNIKKNLKINRLENTFIIFKKIDKSSVKYQDGKSLDNSKFKDITEEIRDCSKVEDKVKVIKEEISSLKDLADVLGADCIFDDEFFEVFKALDDLEISLLIKYIPNDSVMDTDYGMESEKEWHEKLNKYVDDFGEARKRDIIKLSQGIEIDV